MGCVDVIPISARAYVLYTCLLGFLALMSFIGNEMDLPEFPSRFAVLRGEVSLFVVCSHIE
ncbi:hypothetical protein AB3S75_025582 [Citrus x aurantiifolia]